MKKVSVLITGIAGLVLLALVTPSFAAEGKDKEAKEGKEVTLTGEGKCAKCALKETEKCQNVIEVTKEGKKTKYYLTQNEVSKNFHGDICKGPQKVTATGTVKTVEGKKEFTATKIELAKDAK
jgi:uncharacterized protein DUF6370